MIYNCLDLVSLLSFFFLNTTHRSTMRLALAYIDVRRKNLELFVKTAIYLFIIFSTYIKSFCKAISTSNKCRKTNRNPE